MNQLPLSKKSTWTEADILNYLSEQVIPIRLSCHGNDGFPLICSMWYSYHEGYLWCVAHKNALITKLLAKNNKCAFEIASNEMPYQGVRGNGCAELIQLNGAKVLNKLLQRYSIAQQSHLAQWLLARKEQEYAIRIKPSYLTSWDFTERMAS